jgi:hypothetical protein
LLILSSPSGIPKVMNAPKKAGTAEEKTQEPANSGKKRPFEGDGGAEDGGEVKKVRTEEEKA